MPAMRKLSWLLLALVTISVADSPPLNENDFRGTLGLAPNVRMSYRDLACKPVDFEGFKAAMEKPVRMPTWNAPWTARQSR